ncbi:hypothetical protein I9W82_002863 [Candida metapsilosis]|uniref:Uncharacterized protein n=1 Tax=Candida metapsilosis TaxID=273372 RepID=A0A8H7ZFM7_9ASCO|nr:hypothetical protein I9W82_002863 [Candida metapsilosis]
MNFDKSFLSQDDIAEFSPMINQQGTFLSDLDHNIINSQYVTPNPNINAFDNTTFTSQQASASAYPPYDFFNFLECYNDKSLGLETPKSSMDPTFNQPFVGTNFSNKTTPAMIPTGVFPPPFYSENGNSSHTNVTTQTQSSPIVPNIMNAQNYNSVDVFSEPMLSTPSSSTGLRNSPQQFTSPPHAQFQVTPNAKAGPIGLGLNTEQTMATAQTSLQTPPAPPPQMQSLQNLQRQSPSQQSFPVQPPLPLQNHMAKLSPYERANAMFQQQLQQQDYAQLQNDLESTRKFRSESSLNLQALIKQEKEKQDSLNALKQLESPKQRVSKHRRSSAMTIEIKEENDEVEERPGNKEGRQIPPSFQNIQSVDKYDDIDSPTTIEVTSPQSSIEDSSNNANVTDTFRTNNITAEELLEDDHFESLVTPRMDTKEFFEDMVDLDHQLNMEMNGFEYDRSGIATTNNQTPSIPKPGSVDVPSTPKKKKTQASTSTLSSKKKNAKKVLKKSSSFSGSPTLIANPKFQKSKGQFKTLPSPYAGASMGTFPVVNNTSNNASASGKCHAFSSTSPQKRSVSLNQADLFGTVPILELSNQYSFIYEDGQEGVVGGGGAAGATTNSLGRSIGHRRSSSGRRVGSLPDKNFSPNSQSKMFEFQVKLKK